MEQPSKRQCFRLYLNYIGYNKNKARLCLRHNHAFCFSSSFIFFTYFRCKDKNTFWTFNKKNRKRVEKKTQSFAYLANDCVFFCI